LATVKVSGDAGTKPSVTLGAKPTQLSTSGVRVLKPGTGAVIAKGQNVTVDYVLLNGKDGKEADTTYGKTKATFLADPGKLLPGLANGMIGQKIGSRVLVGVAPQDAFAGGAGNAQLGFGKDDPLIFVLDIASAVTPVPPLAKPAGTPVTPPAGLPTVKEDAKGVPVITMPKTAAPTTLVVQPLIKGEGAVVRKGQRISASYVGREHLPGGEQAGVHGHRLQVAAERLTHADRANQPARLAQARKSARVPGGQCASVGKHIRHAGVRSQGAYSGEHRRQRRVQVSGDHGHRVQAVCVAQQVVVR
jgi:FKBP-type peptidyl-prolyl cis-trans isomerase